MMHTIQDIYSAQSTVYKEIINWYAEQDDKTFLKAPEGKWCAGQHLDHLIKSIEPLNKALVLPKLQLKLMFGKPNRACRTYQQLVEKYNTKLTNFEFKGGNPFSTDAVKLNSKEQLIEKFVTQNEKYLKRIQKWKEQEVEKYLLPHPLLGKLLLREMLFFTAYHNKHHLTVLKENYTFGDN